MAEIGNVAAEQPTTPEEFPRGQEPVSSDKKFEVLAGEADGFYRMVVAVSTAFLGGSILFVEKIAPRPVPRTLFLLGLGWIAFVLSIYCVAEVRRKNLESIRLALEGEYDQARAIDVRTRLASNLAQWGMIAGMLFIGAYGLANLVLRKEERMEPQRVIVGVEGPIPLSIAGGSSGGQQRGAGASPEPASEKPAAPPPPPPKPTGKP